MLLRRLWLTDFRNYRDADVAFAPGLTTVLGANGQGKSNLLEAMGWLATLSSFRGVPSDVLIRTDAERALVRAEAERNQRALSLESEIVRHGRNRALINRQPLRRHQDLLGALRVTVFSPDDLVLVKGGPAERRRFLDDTLVAETPRHHGLRVEVDRILRQRNSLLKQAGGRLDDSAALTLEVWDSKLADVGQALGAQRAALVERLAPALVAAYGRVACREAPVELTYAAPWRDHPDGLLGALRAARTDDLRRGVTTVGPHRDDVDVSLNHLVARTHASQGEQRSLALALRLAAHDVVGAAAGSPPVLLLDDVFSELDSARSDALLHSLPPGQTVLTTATDIPRGAEPELVLRVERGVIQVG